MSCSGGLGLPWLGALSTVGAQSVFDEEEIHSDCHCVWRGKSKVQGSAEVLERIGFQC